MSLLQGPGEERFLMSDLPLYGYFETPGMWGSRYRICFQVNTPYVYKWPWDHFWPSTGPRLLSIPYDTSVLAAGHSRECRVSTYPSVHSSESRPPEWTTLVKVDHFRESGSLSAVHSRPYTPERPPRRSWTGPPRNRRSGTGPPRFRSINGSKRFRAAHVRGQGGH